MRIELPAGGWEPRRHQRKAWKALKNKDRILIIGHRRWGKDELIMQNIACAAHERIGNYGHCLPEYAQARKAIWNAVNPHTGKRRIDEIFPKALRKRTVNDEMFIEFKCGSTYQCLGSDQYDRLVGTSFAGIAFSEWALANPMAWGYVQPILTENNGWAAFVTTPRGRNHARRMYLSARERKNWYVELAPITKTRALSAEALTNAKQDLIDLYGEDIGLLQFQQEYYCSFNASILGAFYTREIMKTEEDGRIGFFPWDKTLPVYTAFDIGRTDDTSIWFFQLFRNEIRLIDFHTSSGHDVPYYCKLMDAKKYDYEMLYLPHDAKAKTLGSPKSVQAQFAAHFGWDKVSIVPKLSRQDGIQAVRMIFPRCYFNKEPCELGIEALEQYRREWDEELKRFSINPVHDWTSHPADAFRTLAVAVEEQYIHIPEPEPEVDAWGRYTHADEDWMVQ